MMIVGAALASLEAFVTATVVEAHILGEPVAHVLVLLIATWDPLVHALTSLVILSARTALNDT